MGTTIEFDWMVYRLVVGRLGLVEFCVGFVLSTNEDTRDGGHCHFGVELSDT